MWKSSTPKKKAKICVPKAKKPVIVWLWGGGGVKDIDEDRWTNSQAKKGYVQPTLR